MAQKEYITKRKYRHLTREKQAQIEVLLKLKISKSQIAREVGIARSTLYNELARGSVKQLGRELKPYTRYFADTGQCIYENRRKNSHPPKKLVKAGAFVNFAVKQMLTEKLAPDTICGSAKRNAAFQETVCAKTLYNYIGQGLLKVRNIDLLLRVKRKRHGKRCCRHKCLYGLSIAERPEVINRREEFGHWEIDTVVGKKDSKAVLLTLDERTTRFRHIIKISSRSAQAVEGGIETLRKQYGKAFDSVFRSITSDNGSEFTSLPQLLPGTAVYYAHPYTAYERGLNEKQNSLLRRFFPKGSSFDDVSADRILKIQNWINRLPRKSFAYASPEELFSTVLLNLAI